VPSSYPVCLIGAGPGDPELLTLKAVNRLREAEVVLIDDLVNPAVLDHCQRHVRVCHVGKRGGCASTPQEFIERLMIRESRSGARVVRLKGGDCTLFARCGEEVTALRDAGIEVELINGISSAQAAAAAVGVSLTHRDFSQGVVFVTAHSRIAGAPPPWAELARSGLTLAFFMGVREAGTIQKQLLAAGLPSQTPVAIIENASLANQRVVTGTIIQLTALIAVNKIQSPAQILVGQALALGNTHSQATLHSETKIPAFSVGN
jgi:uroporphyrin-III C-methyltransferase